MPLLTANGIELFYHEAGEGPPLLWLPGMSGDHTAFVAQYVHFRPRHRCIGIDPRGAGRSSAPPGPYRLQEMAADAVALLDHLGIERVDVVGHSMGGRIAQELALGWPQRVGRLALLATGAGLDPWNVALVQSWLTQRRCLSREDWLRGIALWMFSPASFKKSGWIEAFVRNTLRTPEQPLAALEAQAAAILGCDRRAEVGRIQAPTLVMAGESDFALAPARELAGLIPGAQWQVLPGAGHILHAEQPAAVNAALAAFLRA